jgi:hypothetical protein
LVLVSCYPEAVTLFESRTKERKKKEKIRARNHPRETHPLANALVPESRRIRSKRTFERGSVSSNVPFLFSLSSSAFSLFLLSYARKCTRKNPPSGFLSLPQKQRENLGSHAKTRVHKKINKKSLSKTGASRERPSRAKTPLSKEKDAYLGRKRSR